MTYIKWARLTWAALSDVRRHSDVGDRLLLPLIWPLLMLIVRGREIYYADGIEHVRRSHGRWHERPGLDVLWPLVALRSASGAQYVGVDEIDDVETHSWQVKLRPAESSMTDAKPHAEETKVVVQVGADGHVRSIVYSRANPPHPRQKFTIRLAGFGDPFNAPVP